MTWFSRSRRLGDRVRSSVLDRQRHVGNMARPYGARACPNAAPRLSPPRTQGVLMRFASRLIPSAGSSVRGYFLVALGALAMGLAAAARTTTSGAPATPTCRTRARYRAGQSPSSRRPAWSVRAGSASSRPRRIHTGKGPADSWKGPCARPAARRTTTAPTRSGHALQGRLPLHLANHQRPLLLPEDVRLPRPGVRPPGRHPGADHLPVSRASRRLPERSLAEAPAACGARSGAELEGVRDVDDLGRAAVLPERHRDDVEPIGLC